MEKFYQVLALANMVNKGNKVVIVRVPDYNGGHYYRVEAYGYAPQNYEYIEWEGTPAQLSIEQPVFVAHLEPLHENPIDYEMNTIAILKYSLGI